MTKSSKGPEQLSWISMAVSLVLFGVCVLLGRWAGYLAVWAVAWQMLAAMGIWFVLALQFRQKATAERERLDMTQMAKDEKTATIFQAGSDRAAIMAVAQRRLELFEKWFLPIFAVLIAAYQVAMGGLILWLVMKGVDWQPRQALVAAVSMTAVAFVSFLMSRYATGMSTQAHWRPLRAGASSFLASALVCFALAIGLACAQFQITWIVDVIAWAVTILMLVVGAETLLNAVLDIYRPRLKGQYDRAAFDSRLLGVINEPGGLVRSAASTIDYQFGFKVSQTWFYKLLERAIVPLVLFGVVTLYLLSSVVVIDCDQEAIVERFGNPLDARGQPRRAGPGVLFKWPWPFEIAFVHPTGKVKELYIGYVPKIDPKTGRPEEGPLLWGKTHFEQEHSILVASEASAGGSGEGALPVSLVKANIPVQYRVKDLYAYMYNHIAPERLLEGICYHELAVFAAGAQVEVDRNTQESLLGAGRDRAKQVLTGRIQKAADAQGLGIQVVCVGVQGIHPPVEVAAAYQDVIGAVQTKQAWVFAAHAERNRALSKLIGSVGEAQQLYDLAHEYQKASGAGDDPKLQDLASQFDRAFAKAGGDISKVLTDAKAYQYRRAELAKATGLRFIDQVKAYEAAPDIYRRQLRLTALEEALGGIRKYVILADPNDRQVTIVDLQEKLMPSIYDIGAVKEN